MSDAANTHSAQANTLFSRAHYRDMQANGQVPENSLHTRLSMTLKVAVHACAQGIHGKQQRAGRKISEQGP